MNAPEQLRATLQRTLDDLQTRKTEAVAAGDDASASELLSRIDAIERELAALENRVDQMAARSWVFDVKRNAEGFLSQIIARPME